ncbi:single-stranded DNA-binding protein [Providencia huaxiensis]|uniref:single-stranded DNA-binding protein n=1 Tax=Providencia TaxID=586 RepID=UPI002ACC7436|nr:single-stranded DNA-binding protein [Providencia sp. 3007]EMB3082936.1 single-stranded DNA-binding protein [Providencia rettgeri]
MAINIFIVTANLGKDCELRWTTKSKPIATFSLPVKQGYGDHEKISWVLCKLLGPKAEKLTPYLSKGTKVTVTGEFVMEEWTSQNGEKKSAPVIIVDKIEFGSNSNQAGSQKPQQPVQQPQAPQNEPPQDWDDQEIPF